MASIGEAQAIAEQAKAEAMANFVGKTRVQATQATT